MNRFSSLFFPGQYSRGITLAMTGVFVLSFDSLLIRMAMADPWTVLFWRGLLIGLTLSVVLFCSAKQFLWSALAVHGPAAFFSGALFGLSSAGFVLSILNTHVANTVLIFSTAPIFATIFTRIFLQEKVALRTWLAVLATMTGVVIVFKGSFGTVNLAGDLFALFAAAVVGGNFTLLRRHPRIKRTAVVALGGFVTAALAWYWASPLGLELENYLVLGLMGIVQMPLALMLLSVSTRMLSSPEVSIILLLEAVLGPLWVWMVFGESPPGPTWLGGIIIMSTLLLYFSPVGRKHHPPRAPHRA